MDGVNLLFRTAEHSDQNVIKLTTRWSYFLAKAKVLGQRSEASATVPLRFHLAARWDLLICLHTFFQYGIILGVLESERM